MIIDRDENIVIITQDNTSLKNFVGQLKKRYNKFKNNHIILNISGLKAIGLKDILHFLKLSNTHRASKKSFVIVSDKINLDQIPDEIVVVPTLHEAYDVIEMEDIERDLGF